MARPSGLRNDDEVDSLPDTVPQHELPETGVVRAIREVGALLPSDERFGALHDLMSVHEATTAEGFDLRLVELWMPADEEEMAMGMVLSLSMGRQVVGIWDLGMKVETVEGVECIGPGRIEIAVVPVFDPDGDDDEPDCNRISIAYTMEGAEASALRVRYGRRAKIVPKSARRRDAFLQRILRVHEIEVEREDVVHARVFECDANDDAAGVNVLLQLSDAQGKIRTFDLGMRVSELGEVTCKDDRDLILQGRSASKAGGQVRTVVRALGTKAVPERIAIAR